MLSNHERIGKSLNLLATGLYPYIEREMQAVHRDRWLEAVSSSIDQDPNIKRNLGDVIKEDISAQLKLMNRQWNEIFRQILGKNERSIVNELIQTRNQWAHSQSISSDDAYRALDSITRLLSAVGATTQAEEVESYRYQLLRHRFDEQAKHKIKKTTNSVEGKIPDGLKSWREVITPHVDVASGNYQQAEFAADLWEVYLDRGSIEYRDPKEFFRRTYLTQGLQDLLKNALLRLSGNGGDPVIELQTNFGGGKTHAMLALYHLCMGVKSQDLPGMEPVFEAAKIQEPPQNVNTVVLVGNKISPGQPSIKPDGTVVRTLWGEIGWQLGGQEGYEMLREADETSTNPGDVLKDIFDRYAPCLILVDEWVSYARQLHPQADLPGGSFDTHFTFAQTLSESAKNADRTLLIASIPASDIEIGGDRGQEALIRLKNAIGRVESPWRPATAQESFEIVRRRLFQPISEKSNFSDRDAVIQSFSQLYQSQANEFPNECREAEYKRRLEAAYPIHPELFDRLYEDWSTLDRFQRTRGVLRLMAKVIHSLWERDDRNLLIMPAHIGIDDPQVQSELCRYLDDNWAPILEKDVDGENSLPLAIDREHPNLGRYSACRRVARTIYLGSAPLIGASNRGLEDRRIKLGCVQPGESPAIFGDALRRLTERATYLYADGNNRYWIDTQPNVTRTAQDRASQISPDRVSDEIIRRLRLDKQKADFTAVHIAPDSSSDIPDDCTAGVRLVVLAPQYAHTVKTANSAAQIQVAHILDKRGNSPRYYKNLLTFLVPDTALIAQLEPHVCKFLAWDSIVKDKTKLNLNPQQAEQAENSRKSTDTTVDQLLNNAYQWSIVPEQPDPQQEIEWQEVKIPQGQDSPIARVSRKLIHEGYLLVNYAPNLLVMEVLARYIWTTANHIDLKQLWEHLAKYPYMPRLQSDRVLLKAIQSGAFAIEWSSNFAYATGWDEAQQRYLGLKTGVSEIFEVALSSTNLIVKPDRATEQIEANRQIDRSRTYPLEIGRSPTVSTNYDSDSTIQPSGTIRVDNDSTQVTINGEMPKLTRFYGSVNLDSVRLQRDVNQISEAVLQHFSYLDRQNVEITLEIQVKIPDGASDSVTRIVKENCKVLGFQTYEFDRN
jgi:predicted AAA+ superfamily ATPase